MLRLGNRLLSDFRRAWSPELGRVTDELGQETAADGERLSAQDLVAAAERRLPADVDSAVFAAGLAAHREVDFGIGRADQGLEQR